MRENKYRLKGKTSMGYSAKQQYLVYDSQGMMIGRFNTYQSAFTFLLSKGRYDWKIQKKDHNPQISGTFYCPLSPHSRLIWQ